MEDNDRLSVDAIAKIVKNGSTRKNAIVFQFSGLNQAECEAMINELKKNNVKFEVLVNGDNSTTLLITSVDGEPENKKIKNASDEKITPRRHGNWKNKNRGNDMWIPDGDHPLGKFNPDKKTLNNNIRAELEKKINKHRKNNNMSEDFKFEGIMFNENEPDFLPFSFGDVDLNAYSSDRDINYDMAYELMAKKLSKEKGKKYTAKDVENWMNNKNPKNDYEMQFTWHETPEGKMMKVPSVIHGNVSHTGGINAMNKKGKELYEQKNQRMNINGPKE